MCVLYFGRLVSTATVLITIGVLVVLLLCSGRLQVGTPLRASFVTSCSSPSRRDHLLQAAQATSATLTRVSTGSSLVLPSAKTSTGWAEAVAVARCGYGGAACGSAEQVAAAAAAVGEAAAEAQAWLPAVTALAAAERDTLVLYVFADTDADSLPNLAYFLTHGVSASDRCEYVFILQVR